jgi:hypothetical protein
MLILVDKMAKLLLGLSDTLQAIISQGMGPYLALPSRHVSAGGNSLSVSFNTARLYST